jgi:CubicO group peptidase (beta-lactamase class C family)
VTTDLSTIVDGLGPSVAATGVTTLDRTVAAHGPADRVLPLASVTKPLVAYAVLVAVDQGRLDLGDDVDGDGRTVRHLLAHASGLAAEEGGRAREPGTRRVYSNHGFDLLGERVEAAVGRPLALWLHAQVLVPLAMHDTVLDGSPAKDATSTVDDLLTFGRELLEPTLVSADLAEELGRPQWPELDGVLPGYGRQTPNPWGLGFEVRGHKDPHWTDAAFPPTTFGHFGQSGSFLWVSREDGCAGAFLCDEPFGQWAVDGWPALTARLRELGTGERAS